MLKKLIIVNVLVALVSGIILPGPALHSHLTYGAPSIAKVAKVQLPETYDANPQYSFSYDIHDDSTGDIKSQHESRNGDVVEGAYSLIEPDGTRRIVQYTSDPVHGFNAVVQKESVNVRVGTAAAAPITKILSPAPAYPTYGKAIVSAAQPTFTKVHGYSPYAYHP